MATERSSVSPIKRALTKSYRVDPDLRPAVLAMADLLHASVASRVVEDAVVESLLELGYLPSGTKRGLMPTVADTTTPAKAAGAQDSLCDLFDALSGRLQSSSASASFFARAVTLSSLENAVETFPQQPPFFWPARKGVDAAELDLPQKMWMHPRTELALRAWVDELMKRSTKASASSAIQQAIRLKIENLGMDPTEFIADPKKVWKRPVWKKLPHPDATFETRSLEERLLALLQALENLAAAGVAHGYRAVLSPRLKGSAERFLSLMAHQTLD